MDNFSDLINWLLAGDVSIQYQVKRDLLKSSCKEIDTLQNRIPVEGWGKRFLSKRDDKTGLWGNGVYSPKWISTHYTLLDLKNIGLPQANKQYIESSKILIDKLWFNTKGVAKTRMQDLCICGMLLSICSYAKLPQADFDEMIDYVIKYNMPDGGWNCSWHNGSIKSSVHTTLTILEGIRDLEINNYSYRAEELNILRNSAHELLLRRRLFKSLSTGEVIKPGMLAMPYPCRWRYDILRCLDYLQSIHLPYDERMQEAIDIIKKKRRKNGRWGINRGYPGLIHFDMEKPGTDSRWNTFRALRVLKEYAERP